jgi:hypothetical protein
MPISEPRTTAMVWSTRTDPRSRLRLHPHATSAPSVRSWSYGERAPADVQSAPEQFGGPDITP